MALSIITRKTLKVIDSQSLSGAAGDAINDNFYTLGDFIQNTTGDISELQSVTGLLSTDISSLQQSTGTLNDSIDSLNSATGTLNGYINNLNSATGILEGEINVLQSVDQSLQNSITSNEQSINLHTLVYNHDDFDSTVNIVGEGMFNWNTAYSHTSLTNNPHNVTSEQITGNSFTLESGSNRVEINTESGIRLLGDSTVWKDELQDLIGQKLESPASDIVQNVGDGCVNFKDSATLSDYLVMNVQMNHDIKLGSVTIPHIHWWQGESGNPNWLVQFRWQIQGEQKNESWTNQPYSNNAFTYVSGVLNQITSFGDIVHPGNAGVSDILQIRILRDTNNDSSEFGGIDTYTGNASGVSFDVHVEIDSLGSNAEYSKG